MNHVKHQRGARVHPYCSSWVATAEMVAQSCEYKYKQERTKINKEQVLKKGIHKWAATLFKLMRAWWSCRQNNHCLVCTDNAMAEKEVTAWVLFTTATKTKYLGINLDKDVKDVYKKITKHERYRRHKHGKSSVSVGYKNGITKEMHACNVIPIEIPGTFL